MATQTQTQVLVQLEHVTQAYGKQKFVAVHDVNLTLTEGEFVVLLGPSGCGKSTLLRIITGLQHPSDGRVLYRNQPVAGVNPARGDRLPNFRAVSLADRAGKRRDRTEGARRPRGRTHQRALPLLDKVGLDGFETAYPRELSGGMRQKVGFARAMAVEPELLCLDEPFSALDVLSAESLRGELLELWQHGDIPTKLILMVTHNIEEAILLADRIVLMDKEPGRVVGDFQSAAAPSAPCAKTRLLSTW